MTPERLIGFANMRRFVCAVYAVLALMGWTSIGELRAAEKIAPRAGEASTLSLGGRLYDNHWIVLRRRPPTSSHPLLAKKSDIAPAVTWRCVSCHGWDYRGADGHLGGTAKGAALKSLVALIDRDPQEIVTLLISGPHRGIADWMLADQRLAMAKFISFGQHEMSTLIDSDGKARGNALRGKDIYDGVCERCHAPDGKAPIFGEQGDQPSLGWIARHRPAQAIHKIRNGVPSADMVSLRFATMGTIADLLAFLQKLDPE